MKRWVFVACNSTSILCYTYNGRDELLGILRLSAGEQTPPDEDLTDISRLNALGGIFHLTLLERDKAGRIEKIIGEDGKTMHYRYDVMGRVIFQKDGEGRETTFAYHPGGGIKEACYPDGKRVVQ